ncbi:MAG: four helix bundle protein [Spirochaetia bacterium]|nr:four helix bundle protein [Spirochaetia bacterium]
MSKSENIIEQKSFNFALEIIELYKKLLENKEYVISKQLLKSGTSIGANVKEAQAAQSKKDFLSKMSIASKEAREVEYWLLLLEKSKLVNLNYKKNLANAKEIIKIITAIVKTTSMKIKI